MPKVPRIRAPRNQDTIPPSVPTGVAGYAINAGSAYLYWDASSDDREVTGYQLYRNGVPIGTTAGLSYEDTGLTPATTYRYQVAAFDAVSNMSTPSSEIEVTTSPNAAPLWETVADQELTVGVAYQLDVGLLVTDEDGTTPTVELVSGTPVAGLTWNPGSKILSGTPSAVASASLTFRASDAYTSSDVVINLESLNADTTAPSEPTSFVATPNGKAQISLTWSASSDPTVANARTSGLAGYRLYRNGLLRSTLGQVTSYTDTGLSAGTLYSYTLAAFDSAGNTSSETTPATATTQALNTEPEFLTALALTDATSELGFTRTIQVRDIDEDDIELTVEGIPLTNLNEPYTIGVGDLVASRSAQVIDTVTVTLTSAAGLAAGDYEIELTADDSQTTPLERDWLTRSQGVGVIFAHDFRESGEVRAFLRNRATSAAAIGSDLQATPNVIGRSGVLMHRIVGTTLATGVAATTRGAEEVWNITDGSQFPTADPLDVETQYPVLVRTAEVVWMKEGPYQSGGQWYCRVLRETDYDYTGNNGTVSAHSAGSKFSMRSTDWERVMGPLPAGANGKADDDPGAGTYGHNWNAEGSARHDNFRGFYWAHPSVGVQGDSWQGVSNAYMGDEFYIQYRVRVSASKWDASLPGGKSFYLQTASGSSAQQIYSALGGQQSTLRYTSPDPDWLATYGIHTDAFTITLDGQNTGSVLEGDPWFARDTFSSHTGAQIQPGTTYTQCLYNTTGSKCWMWPPDKWVTVLLHIKPSGANYYYRSANLLNALPSLDYYEADGVTRRYPVDTIQCEPGSLASWPDPAEYPYYIRVRSSGSSVTPPQGTTTQIEDMLLTAINYATDEMTVTRNINRTNRTTNVTHPSTETLQYGAASSGYTYGWLDDPRLAPNKNGLIDIQVAVEGETSYTPVFYMDDVPIRYGDVNSTYGNHTENPAAYNSFRPTHFPNHYVNGNGAQGISSLIEFTQIILSKNPIPCPQVWE